jgi:hypothetical protein
VFTAMPNIPFLSADGQMMVWYPGCRLAKVVKPVCESISSTNMTAPVGMAAAHLDIVDDEQDLVPSHSPASSDSQLSGATLIPPSPCTVSTMTAAT